ncbi:MAG: hypothetical protein ABSG43_13145 [Solirubrobacteraceae bacterium]|jgi:hypothetical protein
MASSGKKKTTMAKLNRERRLRERRLDKQSKKDARKNASAQDPQLPDDVLTSDGGQSFGSGAEPPAPGPIAQSHIYA